MNTVQKNNSITMKQVQELLEDNKEKLGLTDKNLKKLIKIVRGKKIGKQMRKVFYHINYYNDLIIKVKSIISLWSKKNAELLRL